LWPKPRDNEARRKRTKITRVDWQLPYEFGSIYFALSAVITKGGMLQVAQKGSKKRNSSQREKAKSSRITRKPLE